MTPFDIIRFRLHHQQLLRPQFESPGEVVKWLGAVQAQDYLNALWGIGMRLPGTTEKTIEAAITAKTMVRSWPMRGTLHFVPPADLRWMLTHFTPRVVKRMASEFRKQELDKAVFQKCRKIFVRELEGGKQLTRDELYRALESKKISTSNVRGLHILGVLAQEGLICFGPRQGKQQTFVLLDEWLPPAKSVEKDEALARLALKYFTGHGPATLKDLAWWAGLTQAEAQVGLEMVRSKLVLEIVSGNEYWLSTSVPTGKNVPNTAWLMSVYDEYCIAYKDRSLLADPKRSGKMKGVDFLNMIMMNGKIAGHWKRTIQKDHVEVEASALTPFSQTEKGAIEEAARQYGKFLELRSKVKYVKAGSHFFKRKGNK